MESKQLKFDFMQEKLPLEKAIQEYVIAIQEEIDQGDLTRKI